MELKEAINRTYLKYWKDSKGEKTALTNSDQVLKTIGNVQVKSIDVNLIDKLIENLRDKGNSNSTINRKLSCLSKVLKYCYDREIIKHMPRIEYLKENEGKIRVLCEAEEKQILNYFFDVDVDMANFTIIGLDTGLRRSDILKLTHANLDRQTNTISMVSGKTGQHILMPVTQRVANLLPTSRHINLKPAQVNYRWNKMKKDLGIDDSSLTPHTLRHTFATRLVMRGADHVVVQKLMGHSNFQMTLRYTHPSVNDLEDAINLLTDSKD